MKQKPAVCSLFKQRDGASLLINSVKVHTGLLKETTDPPYIHPLQHRSPLAIPQSIPKIAHLQIIDKVHWYEIVLFKRKSTGLG